MKVKFIRLLAFLAVIALFAGCGSPAENGPGNAPAPGGSTAQNGNVVQPEQPQKTYGEIAITDEIRGQFYDIAREQRWDFMPWFEAGETPQKLEAYLNWVMIQAQVWESFENPDREKTPAKLSRDYVSDLIKRHFDVYVPTPAEPCVIDRFNFDGNDFAVQVGGWANYPDYEVTELAVEDVDGKDVYTAKLLQYTWADGHLDELPREAIVTADGDKSELKAFRWLEVQFYINEADNEIVFLAIDGGNCD